MVNLGKHVFKNDQCKARHFAAYDAILDIWPVEYESLRLDFTVNSGAPGSVGRDSSTGNLCFESASVTLRPRLSHQPPPWANSA
jgi:hypothetical protein